MIEIIIGNNDYFNSLWLIDSFPEDDYHIY